MRYAFEAGEPSVTEECAPLLRQVFALASINGAINLLLASFNPCEDVIVWSFAFAGFAFAVYVGIVMSNWEVCRQKRRQLLKRFAPQPRVVVCKRADRFERGQCAICLNRLLDASDFEAHAQRLSADVLGLRRAPGTTAQLLELPCAHLFHVPCMVRWLSDRRSCPLCRRAVPSLRRCSCWCIAGAALAEGGTANLAPEPAP